MSKRRKGIPWQTPNFYVPGEMVNTWLEWQAMCVACATQLPPKKRKGCYSPRLMVLVARDLENNGLISDAKADIRVTRKEIPMCNDV
jgi:hypothetical protein